MPHTVSFEKGRPALAAKSVVLDEAYPDELNAVPDVEESAVDLPRLRKLIQSQKPAHTAETVRVGNKGFVVGTRSSVGVDTSFTTTAAPIIAAKDGSVGNIRLNRRSFVRPGPRGRRMSLMVGWTAAVFPIGWVMSYVLLGGVYFLVLTPIGLAMRICGRDPMQRKFDRQAKTY